MLINLVEALITGYFLIQGNLQMWSFLVFSIDSAIMAHKIQGVPKNLLESGAHKTPFLIHLLDMQDVGTYLLTFCFGSLGFSFLS